MRALRIFYLLFLKIPRRWHELIHISSSLLAPTNHPNSSIQAISSTNRDRRSFDYVHTKKPDHLKQSVLGVTADGSRLPIDEEPLLRAGRSLEGDDIPSLESLLFHKPAPTLGEDVALATVPVRVAEPPHLTARILETQQHPFAGGGAPRRQREVLLGVLFRYHQAVQLADIARRHGLVEEVLPLRSAGRACESPRPPAAAAAGIFLLAALKARLPCWSSSW
uniref:Ap2 erf and b3 domain-containing transcription factor rav1-like protein n=1 Tax=Elaeis guineensis var. tenera TaxID=51953 RepID=A0A2S1VVN8_ELAGV|nr:ap2 erf and b3 domain-containing transcription factor rav1-like protein [Elaeis guineensis]